jgi:hypothetical protein
MLSKEKITDAECNCGAQAKKRKNMKLGANDELEKILLEWFQQMRSDNFPILLFLLYIPPPSLRFVQFSYIYISHLWGYSN